MHNDLEFEKAWNNKDYQSILYSASRKYLNFVDVDDLESLKMTILWKCLNRYNEDSQMSFSTYLYMQCKYGILNLITKNNRREKPINVGALGLDMDNLLNHSNESASTKVFELLSDLEPGESELVKQRFFDNLTYKEIADSHNTCQETVRRKIKYILRKSKKLV